MITIVDGGRVLCHATVDEVPTVATPDVVMDLALKEAQFEPLRAVAP